MAFTPAGGYLRSDDVCDCGFMPLGGAMASAGPRLPVPGHSGVDVHATAGTRVDAGLVAAALDGPGPSTDLGITAPALEVFGSLRRWLAFHDPATALLTYTGPADATGASAVPAVIEYPIGGAAVQPSSPCLLGPADLAVLALAAAPAGLACMRC